MPPLSTARDVALRAPSVSTPFKRGGVEKTIRAMCTEFSLCSFSMGKTRAVFTLAPLSATRKGQDLPVLLSRGARKTTAALQPVLSRVVRVESLVLRGGLTGRGRERERVRYSWSWKVVTWPCRSSCEEEEEEDELGSLS